MLRLLTAAAIALFPSLCFAEPLSVHVVTTAVTSVPRVVALTGVLQPVSAFPLAFAQGGRLISVGVQEGASVVAGQELARVDPTQADGAVRAALANLQGADAALHQAEQANDRAQALLKQGAGTRAELDDATKTLLAAQASHTQAMAQLAKARSLQDNTILRAPRGGTVTARFADPGDVANPGQKILTVAATGGLEGVFNAPDGVDLEALLGRPVTLTLIDRPDLILNAKISAVSPLVDARTGAVVVKARLDAEAPAGVVFGTAVVGRLEVPQAAAITLPWTALTSVDGKAAVWTVDPQALTVTQVPVTVSAYGGDVFVVSGGVQAGEIVVTDGSQLLFPGRSVAMIAKGQ